MRTNDHFFLTAKKFWKTVTNKETDPDIDKLQNQIDLYRRLLNIFHAGDCYYYVFSMYTAELEVVSENIKAILGYESQDFSIKFMMDIMHPDDKPYFLNFEYKVVEFFKALPYDKVPFYKVQYDLRLKKKDGGYMRILHQAVQVDYDEKNYYRTLSLDTDISHIKPDGAPCFSLIGLDGEPSYYNIQDKVFTKSFDLFTKREREVLKGIVEGKTSQQIADQLLISCYTINAHRRNIMGKAEVKTPLELVRKTLKEGWI